ncbi:MAG TPA: ankyrin repeat domain-containing protein [Desulfuromonadaceae bacterium]|jgi:ankyrin repeat protein
MVSKMQLLAAAAILLNGPIVAHGYEYDQEATTKLMSQMIVDLGGHDAVGKNSGKTMGCAYSGTRKVTVVKRGETITYSADYRNCREKGSIRDGIYEVVISDDEIVSSTSRRSINGALFDAALAGDAGKTRKLIKAKADVNYTESIPRSEGGHLDEWTPLMSAVMKGSLDAVEQLVSAGAWVNYMNSAAVNALWLAANSGRLDIAKYLVKHGAYIDNRNNEDVTPLMVAAMNGHLDIVKFLIASKAKLNFAHKEGDSALMFALAKGHTDIARLLIMAGADVNIQNRFGISALHIAVAEGNLEGTRLLIGHKADVQARTTSGKMALDVARARGEVEIVKLLEGAIR